MRLSLNAALIDAVEDADFLQRDFLDPISALLLTSRQSNGTTPQTCLRSQMALGILDLMDRFAQRRHIGIRTEMAFTQALSMLVPFPTDIPGFAPERIETTRNLKSALGKAPTSTSYRGLKEKDGLFHIMGAVILAVARARTSGLTDHNATYPEGSVLHDPQSALQYLLRMHGALQLREKSISNKALPGLSDKDILKVRMILDIAEGNLPEIDHEVIHTARRARIAALLSDPATKSYTVTSSLTP
jgi:hypothetical protein